MDLGSEQDERLAYATSLVQNVFDEVYDEFRLWKRDYASRALQAVARGARPSSPKDPISQAEISEPTSSEPEKALLSPSPTLEYTEIWDAETRTTAKVPTQVFRVLDTFSALPAHEYATPSARNIFLGDDPGALPFIPFADDPTFNRALFLREYKKFSWRMASADTDCTSALYMLFPASGLISYNGPSGSCSRRNRTSTARRTPDAVPAHRRDRRPPAGAP
jgi:histone-lysine N-methyltransferase EZH2